MPQAITRDTLAERIAAIRTAMFPTPPAENGWRKPGNVQGAVQSTLAILAIIYGNPSPQVDQFKKRLEKGHGQWDKEPEQYDARVGGEIEHILDSALADFDAGVTASVRVLAKGAVIGDFIALAREALAAAPSEKVASVLVAAALEETLKQIGEEAGVDVYNRDLRGVIQKLKDANILTGAQPGVAGGYVKFRDHAFHGQFEQIERATIESAAAFVEGLLTSRFS